MSLTPRRLLQPLRDPFHFTPHAQQVSAPNLANLFLGISAAHQFESYVERFGRTVPAVYPPPPSKSDAMPT